MLLVKKLLNVWHLGVLLSLHNLSLGQWFSVGGCGPRP